MSTDKDKMFVYKLVEKSFQDIKGFTTISVFIEINSNLLLTQIFWHLWFNENTPLLHYPPWTHNSPSGLNPYSIYFMTDKKFKHFIAHAVMKLLDKLNSFSYLLLTIVQFTTLFHLLFVTWSKKCASSFKFLNKNNCIHLRLSTDNIQQPSFCSCQK